jgi:Fe2+ transport system protein FeoA
MDCDRLIPLDELPVGRAARVRVLQAADDDALLKLAGLGILPGARLEVLRRSPALCIRLGGACYALDRSLARRILVEAGGPADL